MICLLPSGRTSSTVEMKPGIAFEDPDLRGLEDEVIDVREQYLERLALRIVREPEQARLGG